MQNKNEPIDFVILWVDGNDPEWQKEKNDYDPGYNGDARVSRYRDWDNLHFLFRGIEKFTPWVRRVHFVTWGHIPKWMNTSHPKLNIVNHRDYMPPKYLPTFSCNALEMNLHRISGISDRFVYFNDDMFIIKKAGEEVFFKNGLPCDSACLNVQCYNNLATGLSYDTAQATCLLNKYFNMREVLVKNPRKWFNIKYGKYGLRTLYLLPCPRFPGLWNSHMPSSFLKDTYRELWELEPEVLNHTCMNKFREPLDYTQASLKYLQLAEGKFYPRKASIGRRFMNLSDKGGESIQAAYDASEYIKKQKGTFCVLHDNEWTDEEFDQRKKIINSAFMSILPEKCRFEI